MFLLPAIDLMGGQAVRLKRGNISEKTIYPDLPTAFAKKWESMGGNWLHLVDLDAAFGGISKNLSTVRDICKAVSIPCQLGGGMRDKTAIEAALEAGVSRIVLGTRASESLDFIAEMCQAFGPDRIAVGIDARDGYVAIKGWTHATTQLAVDLALAAQSAGAQTIIYTDIATDGMLQGPNFRELSRLLSLLSCNLIASGGISSAEDLRKLNALPGLHGVIIGKALYDGFLTGNLQDVLLERP
ncbi:MAG: 1-(5-phosphoribosyl)-5-[(5-phosphoribosylamino)methylideneamino]imidazole-4-carboxamide isomerase [Verrucomicrobia bacterium]|nr:MAG: 1-(5-phosphoribosyl)-5-[(5-phosphoribosylamino)methylideneamino]imidazole-4-carboxamide isomerase [Verrucomicrobiota bacterium]